MSTSQKVVVVTGASQGIGADAVKAFRKLNYCIVATSRSIKRSEDPNILTIAGDIGDPATAQRVISEGIAKFGRIDTLVNNAGISGPTAPVEDADPDQWEAVMTVDVIGTFHVTRLSIPHLKKSADGSIVVMSSLGGRFGYPNRSAYCTAKMGLIGFAKTLARELGQYNIRVNAIAPGAVAGDRIERVLQGRASAEHKTLEEERAAAMSIQSLKRFVDPKDIAALILFLTSDAGKSISGQVLPIDNDAQTSA